MKPRLKPRNRSLLALIEALAGPGDTLPSVKEMAIRLGVEQARIRHLIARLKTQGVWPYTVARSSHDYLRDPLPDYILSMRVESIRLARRQAEEEERAFRLEEVL